MHVTRYFNTQTTIDENHFGDLGRKPAVEAKQDAEQQDNTAQSKIHQHLGMQLKRMQQVLLVLWAMLLLVVQKLWVICLLQRKVQSLKV